MMTRAWAALLFVATLCSQWLALPTVTRAAEVDDTLHDSAVAELRRALDEESKWIKVHAAEALLGLGFGDRVTPTFEAELEAHGDEPEYRIGIWRVLARAANNRDLRSQYVKKIRNAYLDPNASDRTHAAETLGKLQSVIPEDDPDRTGLTTARLLDRLEENPERYDFVRNAVLELCSGLGGKLPGARSLGNKLRHLRGRVVCGKALDRRDSHGTALWYIAAVGPTATGEGGPGGSVSGPLPEAIEPSLSPGDSPNELSVRPPADSQ